MYINFGNNLFLPEGDDYSKTEFDKDTEEIGSEGNAILQQLRMQQVAEQALRPKPIQKKVSKSAKTLENKGEKLNFKEIFNSVAVSK